MSTYVLHMLSTCSKRNNNFKSKEVAHLSARQAYFFSYNTCIISMQVAKLESELEIARSKMTQTDTELKDAREQGTNLRAELREARTQVSTTIIHAQLYKHAERV